MLKADTLLAAQCGEGLRVMHVACLTCGLTQHLPLSPENPEEKQRALCPIEVQDPALVFPRSLTHLTPRSCKQC